MGATVFNMSPAVEFPTSQGTLLYRVKYEYAFDSYDNVFIDGIGELSADGELSYLTSGGPIRIYDTRGGKLLHSAAIIDPVRMMGGVDDDLPRESDFSEAYRQGNWSGVRPFADVALSILDHFFPNGYRANERENRQQFLTAFAKLPLSSERTTAQVAVLLSTPADADPHDLAFRLRFSARERRSHTGWRFELGLETEEALQAFVTRVIDSLEVGEASVK
jgi:hypothetical protein